MARHLTVATAIDKSRVHSENSYIVLMEIKILDGDLNVVETLRFCQNTENLTFEGNLFIASSFSIDASQEVNQEPRISVQAQDQKKMLWSKLDAYDGGGDFPVRVVIVNTENIDAPAEIDEEFTIQHASCANFVVSIELGAENPLMLRFPRRRQHRNRCPWRYKGVQCKYSGAMTECDFTYDGANGCIAHGNELNFGGFTGIKTIYGV